jgi:hypothetical protein
MSRLSAHRVLLIGTVALLVTRLVLSLARSGPVIMADEAGYLMNARVLAGGMHAEMGSSPFYHGGYSVLLSPILSLDADPVVMYHGVLVANALLAACLPALLYLLVTRCLGASRSLGAGAALAGAAYPSVTALSEVALSENLLFPLTAGWLLSASSLLRTRAKGNATSIGWALATGACAAALWTAHGRMLVAVGVTALLLAFLLARRELPAAGAGALALGAGMAAGQLLNDWLVRNSYGGRGSNQVHEAVSPLHHLDGVLTVLRNLIGQSWYLLVATLGLALVLVVCDLPRIVGRIRRHRSEAGDHLLILLVATTAGLLLMSSIWFAESTRPDQLIYGRYVEPVVPVLIAAAIVTLARLRRPPRARLLVSVIAAQTVVVALLRTNLDVSEEASRWNVASLPSPTGQLGAAVLLTAGVVASLVLCLLLQISRRAPVAVAPAALLLFLPTTAYIAYLPVLRSERDVYPPGWTSPQSVVEERHVGVVAYDLDHFDHVAVKVYQWFLPHTRFLLFHGRTDARPASTLFSGRTLSGRLAAGSATTLWADPGRDQRLWLVRSVRQPKASAHSRR